MRPLGGVRERNIGKQVGGAADACGPTCETDSSVRFNLQNCNIILSKNFMCGNFCIVTNMRVQYGKRANRGLAPLVRF